MQLVKSTFVREPVLNKIVGIPHSQADQSNYIKFYFPGHQLVLCRCTLNHKINQTHQHCNA